VFASVPALVRSRRTARPTTRHDRRIAVSTALVAVLTVAVLGTAPVAAGGRAAPVQGSQIGAGRVTDATTTRLEGVDVSHWQGTISWSKVAAAGKKFAIIKATESDDFIDNLYATNHANAKAAGLWTGAYHFARPDATSGDAIHEADHFAAVMKLGVGDLIPALDLEQAGGLSVAALQKWVTTFLGEVTAKVGIKPMIYTSPAFWKKYMGDTQALATAGYKTLWVAHWGVTTPAVPANNWGGKGWTFWQYSNCGTVSGIPGCVDLDRYNGTDLSLQAYSVFKLAATSATAKQGDSSSGSVAIIRTNFSAGVALTVSGLPAGTTASFADNPTTDSSEAMTVKTPADPTLTPTGTYPITITGSGSGLVRTTNASLVITDGTPPKVTAPVTRLITGKTLGATTLPVTVSWTAADVSGIASTGLQRSTNSGAWTTTKLPAATSTSITTALPITSSVRQRARATDKKTNTSAYVQGPLVVNRLSQQTSTAITYTGTWRTSTSSSSSGGSARYSTSAGAGATYQFTGSSIAWVSGMGPTRGSARIYVDGSYVRTVSLYASTNTSRRIVFVRNWGSVASHKLRIVVAGTAGHSRVDVDAFVRLSLS
jgi:GH25 family lysozyme M1 (1,4-beta-N-acetylmuramidase)